MLSTETHTVNMCGTYYIIFLWWLANAFFFFLKRLWYGDLFVVHIGRVGCFDVQSKAVARTAEETSAMACRRMRTFNWQSIFFCIGLCNNACLLCSCRFQWRRRECMCTIQINKVLLEYCVKDIAYSTEDRSCTRRSLQISPFDSWPQNTHCSWIFTNMHGCDHRPRVSTFWLCILRGDLYEYLHIRAHFIDVRDVSFGR